MLIVILTDFLLFLSPFFISDTKAPFALLMRFSWPSSNLANSTPPQFSDIQFICSGIKFDSFNKTGVLGLSSFSRLTFEICDFCGSVSAERRFDCGFYEPSSPIGLRTSSSSSSSTVCVDRPCRLLYRSCICFFSLAISFEGLFRMKTASVGTEPTKVRIGSFSLRLNLSSR